MRIADKNIRWKLGNMKIIKRNGWHQRHQNSRILERVLTGNNDRCYHCNKRVYKSNGSQFIKHDSATIDHLYSRNDIRRHLVEEIENIVVSCWECNSSLANKENAIMNKNNPDSEPWIIGLLHNQLINNK